MTSHFGLLFPRLIGLSLSWPAGVDGKASLFQLGREFAIERIFFSQLDKPRLVCAIDALISNSHCLSLKSWPTLSFQPRVARVGLIGPYYLVLPGLPWTLVALPWGRRRLPYGLLYLHTIVCGCLNFGSLHSHPSRLQTS